MNIPQYEIKYKNRTFLADDESSMLANIDKYLTSRNISYDLEECISHVRRNMRRNSAYSGGSSEERKLNKPHKAGLTFKTVVNGAKALLGVSLGHTVDDAESNRRGKICVACPKKKLTTDCYGCGFSSVLNKFINNLKSLFGKQVSLNPDLKGSYCDICDCALAIMIPSKISAFKEDKAKQDARPDHCWIKKGGFNYVED